MKKKPKAFKSRYIHLISFFIGILLLISCNFSGMVADPESKAVESPQFVSQPPLPPIYQSPRLNPLDKPHTYLKDTCRYLKNKWNPLSAEPGTVVMVILVKNINRGTAEIPDSISLGEFKGLMEQLKQQGFEAITTKQLQAFMERNVKIPARSVFIIQYGNHDGEYYENIFRDYYENWGWTVTNGWVNDPRMTDSMLKENVALEYKGLIDHQAQGVFSDTTLSDDSSKVVIARELQGSVNGIADHFAKRPVAIIWSNGGFGIRPVEVARRLNFKLGFTANRRGPIQYNWVPLADEFDPQRPALIPEGRINDPLMTLPVYSPQGALAAIDNVRAIGNEASAYAQGNRELELEYYNSVCVPTHGSMP